MHNITARLKILGIFTFAAAAVAGIAGPAHAAQYKITWLLGHENLDYFEEAAVSFKNAVEAGSKGDIQVDIVVKHEDKGAAPGRSPAEIGALVAKGEAEMGHSFADVMGGIDRRLHVFEAPYLLRGYRHMEGVIEGPVGTEMLAGLRASGVDGLSFTYSGGSSGVATKDRVIRSPEGLKGLKVGVYGDEANAAWLTSLGATPVAIGHRLEDILAMADAGALDAVSITWRNFEQARLYHAFKNFNMSGSTYLVSVTYINSKFYDGLPKKYRALISEASKVAGAIERAKTIELNEAAKRRMLAKGVRPVALTDSGKAAFAAALRPAYEGSLGRILGKDLIEKVRTAPDAEVHPTVPLEFANR